MRNSNGAPGSHNISYVKQAVKLCVAEPKPKPARQSSLMGVLRNSPSFRIEFPDTSQVGEILDPLGLGS